MRCLVVFFLVSAVAAAETHTVYATKYHHVFSALKDPLLRIRPGDSVITRTVDAGGKDYMGKPLSEIGNPLTGPFYIEGAEIGDSISVHLDKVRLNRNWGHSSYRMMPQVVTAGTVETFYKNFHKMGEIVPDRADLIRWDLDLSRLVANPRLLNGSGYKFDLPVKPMLGCIGVATPGETVMTSGPASTHGGNMDYNDMVEGVTAYFPVYHRGAYFYLGDGHALQGDGEALGSGIETSLDVQFTVDLRKEKPLSNPRLVNDEYLISIASQPEFSSSMDQGVRLAMTDMVNWLTTDYGLTSPEAHLLMGMAVKHKIVTYFGTVNAMMPRKYLPKR